MPGESDGGRFAWIKLYPDDFEGSPTVRLMDGVLAGLYLRLLLIEASFKGLGLPDDDEALRALLRIDARQMRRVRKKVIDECFERVDGRLVNDRMEREIRSAMGTAKALSEAGKKGAAARWNPQVTSLLETPEKDNTDPDPEPDARCHRGALWPGHEGLGENVDESQESRKAGSHPGKDQLEPNSSPTRAFQNGIANGLANGPAIWPPEENRSAWEHAHQLALCRSEIRDPVAYLKKLAASHRHPADCVLFYETPFVTAEKDVKRALIVKLAKHCGLWAEGHHLGDVSVVWAEGGSSTYWDMDAPGLRKLLNLAETALHGKKASDERRAEERRCPDCAEDTKEEAHDKELRPRADQDGSDA